MKDTRFLIPLALVGAIFVAVVVCLRIYYQAPPEWTTSSPRTQNGITFIGVYRGMPSRYSDSWIQTGMPPRSASDLWAFFTADAAKVSMVKRCRICGPEDSTEYSSCLRIQTRIGSRSKEPSVFSMEVPMEYSASATNGYLVLYSSNGPLGSWKLEGMPRPVPNMEHTPIKLEASLLGCKIKIEPPVTQKLLYNDHTNEPNKSQWQVRVTGQAPAPKEQDQYSAAFFLENTSWGAGSFTVYQPVLLGTVPATHSFDYYLHTARKSFKADIRVEVKRYRVKPDTLVLKDLVLQKESTFGHNGRGDYQGYRLVRCADKKPASEGGIPFTILADTSGRGTGKGHFGLSLERPDGTSTRRQIEVHFGYGEATRTGNSWLYELNLPLRFESSAQTIRIPEYRIKFKQKIILASEESHLIGPVKQIPSPPRSLR